MTCQAVSTDRVDSVLSLFDEVVCRQPEAAALRHAGRSVSYRELDAAANALAAALQDRGLAPEEPVALVLDTGIDYVTAMLAVLRAGGAYMPLSPAWPVPRIERMLALAGCTRLLVDADAAATCAPLAARATLLDARSLASGPAAPRARFTAAGAQSLACILFTSGSTGDPKGVRTLHRNLAYYADWSRHFFAETAQGKVPLTAAPYYAAATSQIYASLCGGGTLHILDGALGQPERLLDFFARHPDHALHCVPTVWRGLLDRIERGDGPGRPAALFVSGEHLPQALVERTLALDPAWPVWNLYGPTECVANISAKRLVPGAPVGIGRPLPGSRLFVADDEGRELGDGAQGRLLIAGPGVCAGYLGADASARKRFFDFTAADGSRVAVYDTGDLARRRGEDIELGGRRDHQVKLRGVRIELADVESNLLRHPEVAQAAVLLADGPEPRLVAFVEPRPDRAPDTGALWRHLAALLPPSMLPERWSLQPLPRLANGKIDRATLRAQLADIAATTPTGSDGEGDRLDATEQRLAGMFERLLDVRGVGPHDDFFALGGHSLKAYELLAAIEEEFGERLSFGAVYAEPTVAALARRLPSASRVLPERETAADGRLSVAQRGLWLLQQAHPDSTAYHLCYRVDLDAAVPEARLRALAAQLGDRHVLLRSNVADEGGEPVFRVQADVAGSFDVLDLASLPATEQDAALDHALATFARTALGRDGGPLHRWLLVHLADGRQVLGLVVHHLVFDGVSASLLLRELFAMLEGRVLPAAHGRYSDFVAREARYLQSPEHREDRAFWSRRLEGLSAQPGFPVRYKRDASDFAGGRLGIRLPAAERAQLAALTRHEGCSLPVLLLTAFAAVLDRYEPGAEFLVASPFANRLRADERDVVGYFTSVLFHRLRWRPCSPLRELAATIKRDTIDLLDHQRLPFPELAALLRERLRVLPPSTFRLMFGYHDTRDWRGPSGLPARATEVFAGQVKCDLHLECFDDGDTLELVFSYRHAALDAAAADDWFGAYRATLRDLHCLLPLCPDERPALSGAERQRVLDRCHGERVEAALSQTLPQLFDAAVARHAERPALWYEGAEISYAELAARVDAFAARLLAEPAAASGPVGICMPHQPALLVALLACARCGFPYVPLDPALPPLRIASILEQAGARLLLTGAANPVEPLPSGIVRLDVTGSPAATASPPAWPVVTPDQLLYIIYTSGSTGAPKGVMVPQRGVVNYLLWMQRDFHAGPDMRVLARTSIGFDISTWELLLPLIAGGCVVLGGRADTGSPESLARLIVAGGANVLQFVPSGLGLFVEAGMLAEVTRVRQIFCGGEALPSALQARVLASGYRGELYNLYGPTEASIFMSCQACDPASPYAAVPIGKPIPNSALYVLDERLQPLPPNVAGDLYIGGEVLADGYWRDEERTRAAFIDAPPGLPGKRLYRVGDKGRLLSDGSFDYLGRDDQQVKVRGYRVELREIEHHLLAHADVQQAVAFTRHWGENDVRLHAAVVPRADDAFDAIELAAWLRARLPAWMLPSTLLRLPSLPQLANGKTDYHRLRSLVEEQPAEPRPAPVTGARDGVERAIAGIWRDVLGHAEFGTRDSFFDAGGHSVLFLKVRELLRERMQADFSIADLYKSPNVADLARAYREKTGTLTTAPLVSRVRSRIEKRKSRFSHGGIDS